MNKKTTPITTTEIARLAGVSIGSVDRALHNRPGINQKTKDKILRIARKSAYRPNRLGSILASRKSIVLGIIIMSTKNPFQNFLAQTMRQTVDELSDFGVSMQLYVLPKIDASLAAQKVREFISHKVDGIALEGIDDPDLQLAVNEAASAGIPAVTFNSDMPQSKRLCFVGQDLYRSGQVAANLLCRFMAEKGKILIIHGSPKVAAHQQRFIGFTDVCRSEFPNIEIAAVQESLDRDDLAYKITSNLFKKHSDIAGIYVLAGGSVGAAQAILDMKLNTKVQMVCNDMVPGLSDYIKKGIVDATILQDPATQGTLPIKILYQKITENKPPQKECFYTKMEIITKFML